MRVFIAVLVLIFSLQSWTKADDIRDFEIEGISIGDSLLDHFDNSSIVNAKKSKYSLWYKNKKFIQVGAGKNYPLDKTLNNYDDLSIIFKPDDINYIIYSIGGRIFCENINECKKQKNKIDTDIKSIFKDKVTIQKDDAPHDADPSGNSQTYTTFFFFNSSNDYVEVSVYDWSNDMNYPDNLKVQIVGEKFRYFLNNEQY